jgi:deazaflavin-dependent oxidoreductase (nitroreductase family)
VTEAPSQSGKGFYRALNRVMVPLHRKGFIAWLDSPVAGWQALITTTGAKTGQPRPTPVNYVVIDDAAWILAGYGERTQWYRNLRAEPHVELLRPGRDPVTTLAEEVADAEIRARVIPRLLRSTGVAGLSIGTIPQRATDEELLRRTAGMPLIRLTPTHGDGFHPGPDDPGGHGWLWRQGLALGLTFIGWKVIRRLNLLRHWVS